jgi:hypothetical protein
MEAAILRLCQDSPRAAETLGLALARSGESLRKRYLNALAAAGQLRLTHPDRPTHPQQKYETNTP